MMPTNVAARMTLAADPGSLQGAVAAGILGAGPVILGTSEACARLLEDARASGREPREIVEEIHAAGGRSRASGIRFTSRSTRAPSGFSSWRTNAGSAGQHVALARAFRDSRARGLGQAADDERLDADRGGPARPRLPGLAGEGRSAPRAHGRPPRASGRGAAAADRLPPCRGAEEAIDYERAPE